MTSVPSFVPRILPKIDDHARGYWTGGADGQLHIAHCGSCRRYVHPPRGTCADCGEPLTFVAVSGNATLFSHTVAHQQFHPAVPTPFVIALVELVEQPGLRLVTNLIDCDPDSLTCGMALRVRFEEHRHGGEPVFVPMFTAVPSLI
jgi:uncharacterized OB-fold protein